MKHLLLSKYLLSSVVLIILSANAYAYDVTVAKDGTGNFTTVQAAIDAAPTGLTAPYTIFIKNGKYREKVTVPSNKPFLQLVGESVARTIVYYDDPATVLGTQNSASFTINANDFSALNITFQNSYGDGSQAVAVLVNADRAAFKNCRFLGNQDTLYVKGNGTPRHYFRNCYIDGNTDFIFGSSIDVFDSCVVYAKAKAGVSTSYITAANTTNGQAYGFVFRNCKLAGNIGTTNYDLGRPWQNQPRVVFLNSYLYSGILAEGWSTTSSAGSATFADSYFGEYKSKYYNGTLVDVTPRAAGSHQLTDAEFATYTLANMFGSWDACSVIGCGAFTPEIAISNFRGVKGNPSTLSWNISWPIDQLRFEIFRSTTRASGYTKIGEVIAPNDTTFNFQTTDNIPPSGTVYYYYIMGSKAGYATTVTTDTVVISSAPTINISGSTGTFNQYLGTPSSNQTYTVSATDLSSNLIITPPVNYEVSANGTTWYNNSSPLSLTPTNGTIATTTIYVRLNAGVNGTYSGDIVHTSTGATTVNVAVTGNTVNPPAYTITTLQQWPLNINNNDSAAVRSAAVAASTPTLKNLYLSNGTTLPAIPAYSTTYGQAFGANANGDGTWTTAVGGPGGNLSRNHYEQFTVTNQSASAIRVDTLLLTSAFYNTNSNTKLAVVYSNSNFTADSADVTGGVGPTGTLAAGTGSFANPILLANQTSGPSNTYALALAGASGDTLKPGQTVTMRLYFACGSTGTPRYAMLKNVTARGIVNIVLPLQLLLFNAGYANNAVNLWWNTTNELNTAFFEVERSIDGIHFNTIKTIAGKNNGASNAYTFTDVNPVSGTAYYRLKITDKDGTVKFSKVVVINNSIQDKLVVYPNPVATSLTFTHSAAKSNAIAQVTDVNGRIVISTKLAVNTTQSTLDVSALAPGVYMLSVAGEKGRYTFVKQ